MVPGIIPIGDERFKIGDALLLKRPDGSKVHARINGLEHLTPNPRHDVSVMLKEFGKADIPIGTEVWSMP